MALLEPTDFITDEQTARRLLAPRHRAA
jgi:hypothetical protein